MSLLTNHKCVGAVLGAALLLSPTVGCENLPGGRREQGAVIGGAGGAAAGAALGGDNRLVGALIGGVLGAGGGYLIGSQLENRDEDEARQAADRARQNPATVEDVRASRTADLNGDGFVSLDELVAMEQAGLSDSEQIDRLRATGQVFSLNTSQERQLRDAGVSQRVIESMRRLNREQLSDIPADRISGPRQP